MALGVRIVSAVFIGAALMPGAALALPKTAPLARPVSVPKLMHEALVPGLQMAIISNGRIEAVRNFGTVDANTGAAVTKATVFEAASLSKPVFAYGVLKLASAGRIDLDALIGRYLPDLKGSAAQLTPRQLLSHTGGLPNGSGKLEGSTANIGRFSYSGDGFFLLQRVVEAITKQPLDDYMRTAVFEPLGMASSSFVWRDAYRATKAFGHSFTGTNAGRAHIPDARAQSSLETTAADLARFMLATIKGQDLDPTLARQLFGPQVKLERGCSDCLGKPRGPLSDTMSWGLGWGLEQTKRGRFAWHYGDNNTVQGYAAIALDGSRGVVILTNSANGHSIIPSVATPVLHVDAPGYAWVGVYAPYTDPARRLLVRIVQGRVARQPDLTIPRADLIQVADRLTQGGKPAEAATLLRRLPGGPGDAGELARLAEAQRKAGDLVQARRDAEAVLARDPTNKAALKVVEKIAMSARAVPTTLLDRYAGRYASPYGPLTVTRSGSRLVSRFEDQPPSDLLAISDHQFLIDEIGLPITFVQGVDGKVTHAVIQAGSPVTLRRL